MLWPCAAMEPGNRKTSVMAEMTRPLIEYEREKSLAAKDEIKRAESDRKTVEARILSLRSQAAKAESSKYQELCHEIEQLELALPPVPSYPRLITQDVTPERTASMLQEQGERLAIFSDEGGIFDTIGGRYSNGMANVDIYCKGWDGSFVKVDRGSRPPVELDRPCLTMCICPQPVVFAGLAADPTLRRKGFFARPLYMLPSSQLGYRTLKSRPINPSVRTAYHHMVRAS